MIPSRSILAFCHFLPPTYLPRYYMYLVLWNITFEPVHYLLVFRAYRDLIQAYLLTDKLHKDV